MFNSARSMVRTVSTLLLLAALIQGCGGGSSEAPVSYPREVAYKTLNGVVGGELIGSNVPMLEITFSSACVGQCFYFVEALKSKESLSQFVAQSSANEYSKPAVVTTGGMVDFSKEQLWVVRYKDPQVHFSDYWKIVEKATEFEIQYKYCLTGISGNAGGSDAFMVVSNALPSKPVVIKTETIPAPC